MIKNAYQNYCLNDKIKSSLLELLEVNQYQYRHYHSIKKILESISLNAYKIKEENVNDYQIIEKGIFNLLDAFEHLFENTDELFNKDENFNYNFITKCHFYSKIALTDYVIKNLNMIDVPIKFFEWTVIKTISTSLIKLRGFYFLEYENNNENNIERIYDNQEILIELLKELSEESIYTLYYIDKSSNINDIADKETIEKIDNLFNEISNNPNIKVIKQDVNAKNIEIIKDFTNILKQNNNFENKQINSSITTIVIDKLNSLVNEFKDFQIENINTNISKEKGNLILLQFDIIHNNFSYSIKLIQNNLELFVNIYPKNSLNKISKDIIYTIFDFNRIFFTIIRYENGKIKYTTMTSKEKLIQKLKNERRK